MTQNWKAFSPVTSKADLCVIFLSLTLSVCHIQQDVSLQQLLFRFNGRDRRVALSSRGKLSKSDL